MKSKLTGNTDQEELCAALCALGMLYGATQLPAAAVAGTEDEAESIRAFILRERPQLLLIYSMETLVGLVRAARARHAESPASIEHLRLH